MMKGKFMETTATNLSPRCKETLCPLQKPVIYEQHAASDLLSRGSYIGEQNPEYEYEEPVNKTNHSHTDGEHEDDSEIDQGDSEISEERGEDRGVFLGDNRGGLKQVRPDQRRIAPVVVIESAFNNRKSFACPKIKSDLKTGTSIGDLSPEDITIIASMGDALATGMGLWPKTNIEFRGAAFPIGGDATIDGLITIPNILREFNNHLIGVSHGMGTRDQLPETQLSVAESGATTDKMPEQMSFSKVVTLHGLRKRPGIRGGVGMRVMVEQARELVRRLRNLVQVNYRDHWTMVIVTIGTEEVCARCTSPNVTALMEAIDILQKNLPRGFIVLLGPIHVSFPHELKGNLLK
ncbi:hypothetical protein TELCIR_11514 [Teladorsagia circumcincta]|uniref:Uncharacterized protein n=1 Tax=Teladorsagia circumcincta TaxID=45464 RepID=A0A2G9U991_TELCI|nr:hypothetical protein TELCIR_11514 [Teladorsagia circumcincta]